KQQDADLNSTQRHAQFERTPLRRAGALGLNGGIFAWHRECRIFAGYPALDNRVALGCTNRLAFQIRVPCSRRSDRFVQKIPMIRTTRLIGGRNRRRTNQSSRRRRARWKRPRQRLFWSSAIRWVSGWRMGLSWYSRKRRKLASCARSGRI